jgi:excisionase family DNA binding protein
MQIPTHTNGIIFTKGAWSFDNVPIFFSNNTDKKKKRPKREPLDTNVPQMVTIKKLSELTGLSQYCIRGLCKRNEIKYIKAGTKILINYQRFLDYMKR